MSSDDNPQLVIVRQDVIHVHEVPDKRKQVSRVEEPTNKWCWTRMQEVCRKKRQKVLIQMLERSHSDSLRFL